MEYLTLYLSGALDFPETVGRSEELLWASKSITQQINERAVQGWQIVHMQWLSDKEVMVTFQRPRLNERE